MMHQSSQYGNFNASEPFMRLTQYIDQLLTEGKCTFTFKGLQTAMKQPKNALYSAILHMAHKNEIVSPTRGFYVIVPPEYRGLGCLPAEYFIPYLMEYHQVPYYAALLTAARYHGAAHQSSPIFQVMSPKRLLNIQCGKVNVQFIKNIHINENPVQKFETEKSILVISTAETTVMDLLKYPAQSGGLNHTVTVINELLEIISPEKLLALCKSQNEVAWKQRLGYLFDLLNATELASAIEKNLLDYTRVDYIPLMVGAPIIVDQPRNARWKIIENATVESDI